MKIPEYVGKQSKPFYIVLCSALLFIIGIADYLTGTEISLSIFYLFPVALATWFVNKRIGILFSIIGAAIWFVADVTMDYSYSHFLTHIWNTFVRLGFFLIVSYLLSKLKISFMNEKRLNRELEQIVLALTETNRELDAFNYTVSHDLKAPLVIIGGFINKFLKKQGDKLDTKEKDMLNAIQAHIQKMERLIKDLLTFSRIGRQKIKPTEIDIGNLVTTALEELKPLSEGRMIKYDIKTLPIAYGDRTLIEQVFINLLSNAIKFTTNKKTAIIEVGGLTEENENVYYVKDNGMGFNSQDSDKLFTVFQRLHGIEELEGSGVGLSIVQRVVKRHGGRVWAEGKINEGASFYFSLPNKISEDS
jgi:light-regulated signal transduction histidine kinase (bacteriophytochrome)